MVRSRILIQIELYLEFSVIKFSSARKFQKVGFDVFELEWLSLWHRSFWSGSEIKFKYEQSVKPRVTQCLKTKWDELKFLDEEPTRVEVTTSHIEAEEITITITLMDPRLQRKVPTTIA